MIRTVKIRFPNYVSRQAKQLVKGLLAINPDERITID